MKLGIFGLNFGERSASISRLAPIAESLGYDSLWLGDHLVLPVPQVPPSPLSPELPILDPLVAFGAASAVTNSIELGTGIIILPQRHPVVLAKQVATLNAISQGRFTLGVGVGYLEPEMAATGVPLRERGRRTDEYLAAMRCLWFEDSAAFSGDFVSFSNVTAYPRPAVSDDIRIVVGGHSSFAHRRAINSAHGWYGWFLDLEQTKEHISQLRKAAITYERAEGLGSLEIIVTPRGRLDRSMVEDFWAEGVDHVVLMANSDLDEGETVNFMERYAP